MLPEKVNIGNITINMIHGRRLIPTNNIFPKNDILTGEISTAEYNIDEINHEVNTNKEYYPKRTYSLLLPFLVKIINKSILIKCVYSFGLKQQTLSKSSRPTSYT